MANFLTTFKSPARLITLSLAVLMMTTWLSMGHALAISGQTLAALSNNERQVAGVAGLKWNGALSAAAMQKAKHMCDNDYWSHTAPDGTTGWNFIRQAGYKYKVAGENLAKGFGSDEGVIAGWMASPTHRANVLSDKFEELGIASLTCDFQGRETTIVVAHYGAPAESTNTARTTTSKLKTTQPQAKKLPEPVHQQVQPAEPEVLPAKTPNLEEILKPIRNRPKSILFIGLASLTT